MIFINHRDLFSKSSRCFIYTLAETNKIFFKKNSENICRLLYNLYICCRNNTKRDENIYSKYILVVALRTTQKVVRNEDLYVYTRLRKIQKEVCCTCDRPLFFL